MSYLLTHQLSATSTLVTSIPTVQEPSSTFRWATITDLSPLRVRLDGESVELPITPECLVHPSVLTEGARVWVQLFGSRLLIHGVHQGGTIVPIVTVDIGGVILWSGGIIPSSDWLWCDGAAVSRTTYAQLWAICYTVYGAGDGSTTFNVPNFAPLGSANYIIRAL